MEYNFDYFISYAHKDNVSENDKPGFVDEFVEKLQNSTEHQQMFGEKVNVFFDKDKIHSMSEWDIRIRSSLASSRFFVVLLSPNYFNSEYCAREFDWWMKHEMHRRVLGEGTAPMLIVSVNGLYAPIVDPLPAIPSDIQDKFPNWVKQIRQIQSGQDFDMHNLKRAKIDEILRNLHRETKNKVLMQDLAEQSRTNIDYPGYNENFVGRRDDLSFLREKLSTKTKVAISAINGLGGIGKTELAITYGHAFAWDYRLGRVFAKCDNKTSLEDVLLSCGIAEMYGMKLNKNDKQSLTFLKKKMESKIQYIKKRNEDYNRKNKDGNDINRTVGAHLLLILDNVDRLELISQNQIRLLPDYFHVIITTRKFTNELSYIDAKSLNQLSEDESVELLSNLRPFGKDSEEAKAAREIAKLLGGFTLAVEITGAYLRKFSYITYQEQYEFLKDNLPKGIENMVKGELDLQNHQAECISVILKPTLEKLSESAREALTFAAQMPPDSVALGWLPELVGLDKKEGKKIIFEMTGANLLTQLGGEPNIARIHRLVAESLKIPEKEKEIISKIRAKCNDLLNENQQFWFEAENSWNISPVSEFLKLLAKRWSVETSDDTIDWNLSRMMGTAGGILKNIDKLNDALDVYKLRYIISQKRAESFPGNEDVAQDHMISRYSLIDLSDALIRRSEKERDSGNDDSAEELLAKSQEIKQMLQLDGMRESVDADSNQTGEEMQFDFFISYSHADNQSEDGKSGFVDEFVEKLRNSKELQKIFGGKVSVYFDKHEIHSMSDWDNRIRYNLAHSRFFIVLISPNYFKSEFCAKEFDWWIKHEWRSTLGQSIAPIQIVSVPELYNFRVDPLPVIPPALQDRYPNWLRQLRLIQSGPDFDLHDLLRAKIDRTVQALGRGVKDQVFKLKIAELSPTNAFYPPANENFVGRRVGLSSLRMWVRTRSGNAICAINGLDGIGKTELALTYGHAFAWDYGLGRVFVNCENMDSLEDVILSSGIVEMHGLELEGTNEQQLVTLYNALEKKIKLIQQRNKEKKNVDRTLGAHVLLILDNVNRLELISQRNLDKLPYFFHVIITTRESANKLPYIHTEMVDRLSEDESVELLSNLRSFTDPQDEEMARSIAKLLDGFTLAVALTGEYLKKSPHVTYQQHYERLMSDLSQSFQKMGHETPSLIEHQIKTMSMVLMFTLSELTPNARKAINFASQMSSEAVALDWLPELVGLNEEDGFDVLDELIGYNLLTPLEKEPNIARIHRLVADSVKQYIPEEECKEIIDDIRDKCNDLLEEGEQFWYTRENSWNIIPVSEFLKMLADYWTIETSDEEIDWDLTEMLNTSGDILKNLGKIIDAQDVYNSLYEICQKRAEFMPENVQVCLDLSNTCNKLGDLKNASGNTASAREWYEKALEISHRLADKMPDSVDAQRYLSVSYFKHGDVEYAVGNTAAAREWYEKALKIALRLVKLMPDDVQARRDLSISYNKLGDLEKTAGNAAVALAFYEKTLEIRKRLVEQMPDNVDALRNLSVSYNRLGDMEKASGNSDSARDWYEKSLEISKRLAELMPDNVDVQRDLSVSCNRLGNLEQDAGNVSTARDWYEKSLEISKRLAELMLDSVVAQRDLSVSYNNIGDLERISGNATSAREWFEKALEIYLQIARKMPENVRVQENLQLIQQQIHSLDESQTPSLEESQTPSMESKAIQEDNASENAQAQKELDETREKLAQAQKELAEMQEKLAQTQTPWYIKLLRKLFGKD